MAMIELYKGDSRRIQHFCKVHSYARLIAQMENVDYKTLFIIETAALTHDIGIHTCEEKYGECGGKLQEKEGLWIRRKILLMLYAISIVACGMTLNVRPMFILAGVMMFCARLYFLFGLWRLIPKEEAEPEKEENP